jgi:hypothetical protein
MYWISNGCLISGCGQTGIFLSGALKKGRDKSRPNLLAIIVGRTVPRPAGSGKPGCQTKFISIRYKSQLPALMNLVASLLKPEG